MRRYLKTAEVMMLALALVLVIGSNTYGQQEEAIKANTLAANRRQAKSTRFCLILRHQPMASTSVPKKCSELLGSPYCNPLLGYPAF